MMHHLTDLAAGSSAAKTRLRVEGTRHLVEAALDAGVERSVTQSIAWCCEPCSTPAEETVALDTVSVDRARRATVDAVISIEADKSRITNSVVLRNGMLYGSDTWYAAAAAVTAIDWPAGAVNTVTTSRLHRASPPGGARVCHAGRAAVPVLLRARSIHQTVPRPMRDGETIRYIVGRAVVTRHRRRCRPRKVIVQDLPKARVTGEADVHQGPVEAGDGPTVHLLVGPVAAVELHD
jgi:hypothetical protein